jgi:hypothetical protein
MKMNQKADYIVFSTPEGLEAMNAPLSQLLQGKTELVFSFHFLK